MEKIKREIQNLYQILRKHYGSQGWWPLLRLSRNNINPTLRGSYSGYHPNDYNIPDQPKEVLEIMLGAILTQNTSWVNAEKALFNLESNKMISFESLHKLSEEKLALLIKSSGYYNQKAKKIHYLMSFLAKNPISTISQLDIIELRSKLLSVKGIGPETADSIILYAFKKPIFVIDAYTKRLFGRLDIIQQSESYDHFQMIFHASLRNETPVFNEYHALIVQHCAHICTAKPKCDLCFINEKCAKNIKLKPKKKTRNKKSIKKKVGKQV
ncbi:Endonuclease III [Candidatus Lokiarchaeum ossiferum]|uniref:Endonuclease III n=1 Tax=Candidatus Lokiarchaeum ossiferum TaxID=2951803 RepID=A0ABY6HLF6_9ARCH|nr:Endonuclease III [Candidatus Lokiarchaeum sp. B-35]